MVIGAAGRLPPTDILFISEHSADPENSGAGFYESLEGTYVQIDNPVVVGPTNDFGEFWVVADGGAGASGMNSLGGITATPSDANPERIQIQVTDAQKPQFQHALGDTFVSIEGYVTYDRGLYEIRLANTTGANPKAWAPEPVGEAQEDNVLTIAGYNVENLDPVIEAVDKTPVNDPDDDVGVGKFSSIAEHVVNARYRRAAGNAGQRRWPIWRSGRGRPDAQTSDRRNRCGGWSGLSAALYRPAR
ncbi:hypothetical protein BQ8794_240049 [Mesorhizobium prunaredense]|uniref:Uncharacterized protein n=1 Tax=Mesorhizobium prunaredense TaxID=1631249 RepID=A0A1R3V7H8_9HYPH|nr:hypothetical protein BQ8794_240049 [Mesorhizobium prunaredense]